MAPGGRAAADRHHPGGPSSYCLGLPLSHRVHGDHHHGCTAPQRSGMRISSRVNPRGEASEPLQETALVEPTRPGGGRACPSLSGPKALALAWVSCGFSTPGFRVPPLSNRRGGTDRQQAGAPMERARYLPIHDHCQCPVASEPVAVSPRDPASLCVEARGNHQSLRFPHAGLSAILATDVTGRITIEASDRAADGDVRAALPILKQPSSGHNRTRSALLADVLTRNALVRRSHAPCVRKTAVGWRRLG